MMAQKKIAQLKNLHTFVSFHIFFFTLQFAILMIASYVDVCDIN